MDLFTWCHSDSSSAWRIINLRLRGVNSRALVCISLTAWARRVEKRILVIDDDEAVRRLVMQMLQRDGYTFIEADGGQAGVTAASEESPDLILCDCTMPGMTGIDVLEILRNNESTSSIPFVFLTATDDDATRQRAAELGAAAFMTKPIRVDDLRKHVSSILLGEVTDPGSSD